MSTTRTLNLLAAALVGGLAMSGLATQALAQETRFDKLANLPFAEDYPTPETAQQLKDELRVVEDYKATIRRYPNPPAANITRF